MRTSSNAHARRAAARFFALFVLVAAAAIVGCGRNPVVLRVGDRPIRLQRFTSDFHRVAEQDTTLRGPNGVRAFLDDYVNKNVLELVAHQKYPNFTPEQQDQRRAIERDLLRDEIVKREIGAKVRVSDQDLHDFYKRRARVFFARHIMLASLPEAEEVLGQVKAGADFDTLAASKSLDPYTRSSGGVLPHLQAGMFYPEFEDSVMKMQPGQLAIVQSPVGFHVVRVDSILARTDTTSFESERGRIEEVLKARQMRALRATLLASLLARYHARIDTAAVAWYDSAAAAASPQPVPTLGESEKARPLATFQVDPPAEELVGDTLTAGGYVESLRGRAPGQITPGGNVLRQLDSVEESVFGLLCTADGKRRGIERDPEVADILHDREEKLRVTRLYKDQVESAVSPNDEDYHAYYEAHRDAFKDPESWSVQMIAVHDSALARRTLDRWRAGTAFGVLTSDVQRADTMAVCYPEEGMPVFGSADTAPFVEAFAGLGLGDFAGPVLKDGRAYIAHILAHTPVHLRTYDEAFQNVRLGADAEKKEARLQALLADGKKTFPVAVNEKALAKVKPLPTGKRS